MLPRSPRLVILHILLIITMLHSAAERLHSDDIIDFSLGAGPHSFVSKDPRFAAGYQFGYEIHGSVMRSIPANPISLGAYLGYRSINDSAPVSGVLYRGFAGVSAGAAAMIALSAPEAAVRAFTRVHVLGNYSTYHLTELEFFHLSLGVVPGFSIAPSKKASWLTVEASLPLMWEPRRGTPLGFSGSFAFSATYRLRRTDGDVGNG